MFKIRDFLYNYLKKYCVNTADKVTVHPMEASNRRLSKQICTTRDVTKVLRYWRSLYRLHKKHINLDSRVCEYLTIGLGFIYFQPFCIHNLLVFNGFYDSCSRLT